MSRALASVPVGQFRNFAGPETCGPIDASQDTLHGRQHPISHPLPPCELGANASQTPVWRPGSETSGDMGPACTFGRKGASAASAN